MKEAEEIQCTLGLLGSHGRCARGLRALSRQSSAMRGAQGPGVQLWARPL